MNTKLLYMEDMQALICSAIVQEIKEVHGKHILILDQTVFYPQGGGQPYDTGVISNHSSSLRVEEVRFIEGKVHHIGILENGEFQSGAAIECRVDKDRRILHTRLHSAGHIVDMGLKQLVITWTPGKGYHFPDGPYVEYYGNLDAPSEQLKTDLENACNEIIMSDLQTTTRFVEKCNMSKVCEHVPDYLPENKPARVVMYGDFGIPCGGTHVRNLGEIGSISIRKIKQKKGLIKVSYQIS